MSRFLWFTVYVQNVHRWMTHMPFACSRLR